MFLCALQWSPSLDTFTRGIQPTAFHLPQTCTCTFAHTYALKQMHKHCSSMYTGTLLKYVYSIRTNTHASTVCGKEIHHMGESPSILSLVAYIKRENEAVLSRILFIFYIIFLLLAVHRQLDCRQTTERYRWIYRTKMGKEAAQVQEPYLYNCSHLGTNTVLKS